MATKQEEGQVEAEAGKDAVLVRSVRERDRWVQLRNLELNLQLGLIDLQDLEEELLLKPLLKDPPNPDGAFEELEDDETTDKYYEVFEKQSQLLDRQKDLLKEHETELSLKRAKLKDLAGNAMIKTFQSNYQKVVNSHKQITNRMQILSSANAELQRKLETFRNDENELINRRKNLAECIEKQKEELIANQNELESLRNSRFASPQNIAIFMQELEAHVNSISDLGDEIELQKDDLFISWDDFLDLAACEKQLKLYGKCERKTADKLTDEERKTRTNEDMNKLYVQGRYFERRHVQPFLNQVDRNFPDKKANGLRTCGDFRNVTLKALRPLNKGKFKKGSRYWGFAFNEKEPNRNNLDINMRVTSQPVGAYVFVEDVKDGRKKALKYETSSHFAVMAGTGKRGAVPIHLEYPLEEIGEKGGKRIFIRVKPSGAKVDKDKFQETSEEKDISEEHKARSRADVNYLKKRTNNYEKVERSPNRKLVSVTQIYSRHEDAIQRSLDIAEHLANQPSPIKLDEKEQHRIAREKEVERQQKLKRKAQQEEEAKRRQKTEKEKKAKEAEDDAVLQAEYEKNLKAQNTQGGRPLSKQMETEANLFADLDKMKVIFKESWPTLSIDEDLRDLEVIRNKVYKMDAIMRGCWSVCSVFKALKWVSSSFFVIEEHLQTPKRHLREMVGLFKGDTSQCKLALLQYLQIEPQISQLEDYLSKFNFKKSFHVLLLHARSEGNSWWKTLKVVEDVLLAIEGMFLKRLLVTSTNPTMKIVIRQFLQVKGDMKERDVLNSDFFKELENPENWHPQLNEMMYRWSVEQWLQWTQRYLMQFKKVGNMYQNFEYYLLM